MLTVIADTGVLISLGHIRKIHLIQAVLGQFFIPRAVWNELLRYDHPTFDKTVLEGLEKHIHAIGSDNYLALLMDSGEAESVILYQELKADFLLIDDSKARKVAESLEVNCIGSIGLLIKAKEKGLIDMLKPYFEIWLSSGRYFAKSLLEDVLREQGEW